jgi:peptidoglycan lytic transglycosylase
MKLLISALIILSPCCYGQVQTGKASFYADRFDGHLTSSGERYHHKQLTAAHKTLPFGTIVRVTNVANNKSVEVRINDRGPYVDGRIIDLSRSAAEKLGFVNQGLADVKLEVVDPGNGKESSLPKPIDRVSVDEKEFYELEITRLSPHGFGVQIGTYQELVNLMRLAENLKKSYRKEVTVQVKVLNGVKYYSIIIGDFPKQEKALQFRDHLIKKYPDAFVVEYDRL